jgi:phospho-N-acetylmuramoyl-pentapeptide-transferase
VVTAILLSLLLGPRFHRDAAPLSVDRTSARSAAEPHRSRREPRHGGLLILFTLVVPTLLWANLTNLYVWIAIGVTAASARSDSSTTTSGRTTCGLTARAKFLLQVGGRDSRGSPLR